MDPQAMLVLVNLGVAGVGLYLFATGKLVSKPTSDERQAAADARLAEVHTLYDARIAEGDERWEEMRADRDAWKHLALQTEDRLDLAVPTVATAIGAPVESEGPAHRRARIGAGYTAGDQTRRGKRGR